MFQFLITEIWRRIDASERRPVFNDANKIIIKPGNLEDLHERLQLVSLNVTQNNDSAYIAERSENDIFIQLPKFQASATIEMAPTEDSVKWKVGWIQALTGTMSRSVYGNQGSISHDVPGMVSGEQTMINDSLDQTGQWPWYCSIQDGVVTLTGPNKLYRKATIRMSDSPFHKALLRSPGTSKKDAPNLTHVEHDHTLYTWLVAWDQTAGKAYIMKTIKWGTLLDVDVDPTKPQGERARWVRDAMRRQPEILADDVPIPKCAMFPPNYNKAQMIVWRPTNGKAVCIQKPKWKKDPDMEIQERPLIDPKIAIQRLMQLMQTQRKEI